MSKDPLKISGMHYGAQPKVFSNELDGGYHLSKNQKEKDANRTHYLRELGIQELRFTNREVLESIDNLVQKLQIILSGATPSGAGGERGQMKRS